MHKKMVAVTVMLVLGAFGAGSALAQSTQGQTREPKAQGQMSKEQRKERWVERKFEKFDTNKDGKLERQEFMTEVNTWAEEHFTSADTNNDSVVTREEFEAALKRSPHGKNRPKAGAKPDQPS